MRSGRPSPQCPEGSSLARPLRSHPEGFCKHLPPPGLQSQTPAGRSHGARDSLPQLGTWGQHPWVGVAVSQGLVWARHRLQQPLAASVRCIPGRPMPGPSRCPARDRARSSEDWAAVGSSLKSTEPGAILSCAKQDTVSPRPVPGRVSNSALGVRSRFARIWASAGRQAGGGAERVPRQSPAALLPPWAPGTLGTPGWVWEKQDLESNSALRTQCLAQRPSSQPVPAAFHGTARLSGTFLAAARLGGVT